MVEKMAPAAGWSTPVICCMAFEVRAIFQPGDLAPPGLGQEPVERVLDPIGVVERRRADGGVEGAVAGARPVRVEAGARGGVDRLGCHAWSPSGATRWSIPRAGGRHQATKTGGQICV